MKVLFVYPSIDCPAGINHGLAAISGVLKSRGHETKLIHVCDQLWPIPDYAEIKAIVEAFGPGIVGFSAMSQQYEWCIDLAAKLDRDFGIPTVVGGVHCTMVPEEVTADGRFDFVCVGEGEYAMLDLVERLEHGLDTTTVPNIRVPSSRIDRVLSWIKPEALAERKTLNPAAGQPIVNPVGPFPDLETLPPLDYDLFDLDYIIGKRDGWMGLLASRGCPYKCTYCFNKEIVDRYIEDGAAAKAKDYLRTYPVERVIGEIRDLKARFPHLKTLIFDDDLFTLDRDYVHRFCAAYDASGLAIPFVVNAHVQKFDEDMAEVLSRSGCLIVKYGLESGSDEIRRKVLWRTMTNKRIEESFGAAHKFDLHTSAFVMFGLPFEDWGHIQETIRLCARIKMGRFRWAIFFPFPGTAGYRIAKDADLIDYERMKGLGNYFDGSCLKFGPDHDLLIEKLGKAFHWWVNAESDWPTAPIYRALVSELERMDRGAWDRAKSEILKRDRELSEELLQKGLPHYSVRYSHVMAVNSDFVNWERRQLELAQAKGNLRTYSLD